MNEFEATAIVTDTLRKMHLYGASPESAAQRLAPALTDPVVRGQTVATIQQRIQQQHAVKREAENRAADLAKLRDLISKGGAS